MVVPCGRLGHSRQKQQQHQHLAGCRPLRALRQLHVKTRAPVHAPAAAAAKAELSPKEQLLLQHVMNYQYKVDMPEGQLVISPLREQWLQRTADLLADTFVDAKGIQPYRRYVRRNIGKYLEQHIAMPPAAVLVTAVLRRTVQGTSSPDLGLHDLPTSAAAAEQAPATSSSSSDSEQQPDAPQPVDNPLGQLVLNCFGWLVKPDTPHTTAAAAGPISSSSSSSAAGDPTASADASDAASSSGRSSADAYAAVSIAVGDSSSSSDASTSHGTSSGSSSIGDGQHNTSSSGSAGPKVVDIVSSALQRLSDGVALAQLRPPGSKGREQQVVETLVGVAEVSFNERTRSQTLTLNPPQRCAYLCNMAVAKEWQRKGIASTLMTAVEDLCLLAGETDLYLHLRFKDATTAGALYRKHGFTPASKDCWLLLLVGQEPRFLMLKQLLAARTLVGQVLLPGFKQGVTAAELQQQQQEQPQQQVEPEGAAPAAQQQQQQPAPAASPAA